MRPSNAGPEPDAPLDQKVIVYGKGRKPRVYDTAYTDDQVKVGITRCVMEHGRWAGVRALPADSMGAFD